MPSTTKIQDINQWVSQIQQNTPLLTERIIHNLDEENASSVKQGLIETLSFLYLCTLAKQPLTPSYRVDNIWHEFILFTRSYQLFCENQLGQFIHHQPSDQPGNELQQYRHTLDLYHQELGTPNISYWPKPQQQVTQCGTCENE